MQMQMMQMPVSLDTGAILVFFIGVKVMTATMIICATCKWALNQRSAHFVRTSGVVGGMF